MALTTVNHSASRRCYQDLPLEELAQKGKELGLKAIDLLRPEEWETVRKYGLECSLGTDVFADIQNGFNDVKNHFSLQRNYKDLINKASNARIKRVIVFSGNRNGKSGNEEIENCAIELNPLVKLAEKKNVTLVMELLNSKCVVVYGRFPSGRAIRSIFFVFTEQKRMPLLSLTQALK